MKNILFLCKNPEVSECIEMIFSKSDTYSVNLVAELDKLYIYLDAQFYDAVLIGSGFSETEELSVKNKLKLFYPYTRFIKHYGGGSGLLLGELNEAFKD